jgi:hypothetical protein
MTEHSAKKGTPDPVSIVERLQRIQQEHESSRRSEEPAITFGMDDGSQIVFRDQAALDDYVAGVRLEGWVPLGSYIDVQLPSGRAFECSAEVDEAGLPKWERIITRPLPPERTEP